jgi:hypothetical protein
MGTRGAFGAVLSWEVGAGAAGTRGTPEAALRREAGAGAQMKRDAPRATLSREAGTTPSPPSSTTSTTTTTTSTSATSASKGYHLHVVLADFCSSHSICAITTVQLWGDVGSLAFNFDLFSSLTVCSAPVVTTRDVRVYLLGYIFCIINCHIYRDIFGRIDIMYCRLCVLPSRLLYYIYIDRDVQYNTTNNYTQSILSTLSKLVTD